MAGFFDYLQRKFQPVPEPAAPISQPTGPLQDDAFLAFVSHELRTPLTAIIGYSEILQEDAVFLEQKDFLPDLKKIQAASEHLLALVDDIVDLSRIDAGKADLSIEEFKAGNIAMEVAKDARALLDRSFCTLEVDVAADLPVMRGDRAKVRRGVSNLLRHALGLAAQGQLRLSANAVTKDGVTRIKYGVHHPELKLRPRDFKAIVDGASRSASGLPQFHGSGLGLVITERFCRMMGGELTAEASEKGAILVMTLPIEPPASLVKPPAQG
jgi:signal transduction histidine kinase